MQAFSSLIAALDQTTKTTARQKALVEFFQSANKEDALWAVALFTNKKPRKPVKSSLLREWAAEISGIPLWLFEESYHITGDLAETIALVLPQPTEPSEKSLNDWMRWVINLHDLDENQQRSSVVQAWQSLSINERFVLNKLLTGGFRVGVSQKSIVNALATYLDKDTAGIAHRLMGSWKPENTSFDELFAGKQGSEEPSQPYPFSLAYPLEQDLNQLGDAAEWMAEYKWDGIRGQLIVRQNEVFLWSRGEELVTDKFPEICSHAKSLPNGTVLDGEILAYNENPLPFGLLQTRLGRKTVSNKLKADVPVVFMAYDLLEIGGEDLREKPLIHRRIALENLLGPSPIDNLLLSKSIDFNHWEEVLQARENSRTTGTEGLMLKRKSSSYHVGRKKGDWWKWKVDPFTIDAVLLYAMRGHGRRANLYTDYTFAVWNGDELVPFAKAYSGLTDEEFRAVDAFVKRNTIEKFGPVRSVKPELVFELAFEGISRSGRHKSGIALRFPRMKRWRKDKAAHEANTLGDLEAILEQYS